MAIEIAVSGSNGLLGTVIYRPVIGRVLVLVTKQEDGSLTIEQDIAVTADSREDNELVEAFIKSLQDKLKEVLPKPEFTVYEEQSKIWVPE